MQSRPNAIVPAATTTNKKKIPKSWKQKEAKTVSETQYMNESKAKAIKKPKREKFGEG